MAITAEAPRGGLVEELGGISYTFILRIKEIERFEDKHRGIFEFWDSFFERSSKPTSLEIKDLLALGLVGGGLKDQEADAIIEECSPADYLRLYQIAQAVLGIAFMPDAFSEQTKKKVTRKSKQGLKSVK
tara:strand:+ start:488 stop:877 length:390 start_codon:yes stop_codon:yes gene_type:complete